MERRMSATEARVHFGEVLHRAAQGDVVIVEKSGLPLAVVVSVETWEHHQHHEDPWERTARLLEESREEWAASPHAGALREVDIEAAIDAGREERDRAILGDILR